MQRLGIAFDNSMGVRDHDACRSRPHRQDDRRAPDRPHHERVGAHLAPRSRPALPAACYYFDKSLERVTQDPGGVTAHFADGSQGAGRPAGRRRRLPLDRARAVHARTAAELCRLRRLARHARRARHSAGNPRGNLRALRVLPAGGRAFPRLRGAGPQQRHGGGPPRL